MLTFLIYLLPNHCLTGCARNGPDEVKAYAVFGVACTEVELDVLTGNFTVSTEYFLLLLYYRQLLCCLIKDNSLVLISTSWLLYLQATLLPYKR